MTLTLKNIIITRLKINRSDFSSKKKQWKKPKSAKIHHLHSKYAPHESDYVKHVMTLTVKNTRSIATLRYNCDIITKDVPIEMIQIDIYTLQSDSVTLSLQKMLILVTSLDASSRSYQYGINGRRENTSN